MANGKESTPADMPTITVRMKKSLIDAIQNYVLKDTHNSLSDFVRDACRAKIEKDAPHLLREMLKE